MERLNICTCTCTINVNNIWVKHKKITQIKKKNILCKIGVNAAYKNIQNELVSEKKTREKLIKKHKKSVNITRQI